MATRTSTNRSKRGATSGDPTNENRPYGASSAIERGTAERVVEKITEKAGDSAERACICGCGGITHGGAFLPGHDSKARSQGLKVQRGEMKASELAPETRTYLKEGGMI